MDKHDFDYVKHFIEVESNSGAKLLDNFYDGNIVPSTIKCKCGNIFKTRFYDFKTKKKRYCENCMRKKGQRNKRFTVEKINRILEEEYENKYSLKLINDKYLGSSEKHIYIDNQGYLYYLKWDTVKRNVKKGYRGNPFFNGNPFTIRNIYNYFNNNNIEYRILNANELKNAKDKAILYCIKHEVCFTTDWNSIYSAKQMCPLCNNIFSKAELKTFNFLKENKILFNAEYGFDDLKTNYDRKLKFDFAVFKEGKIICLIELDGKQHFEPIEYWGGQKGFEKRVRYDNLKNEYCSKNNIKLVRIPYWDFDNIEKILKQTMREII